MERRQRLSERRVKSKKPLKTKRIKLHCGEVPGFYVEVSPSGHKACYWYRRVQGKEWRLKLSDFGDLEFETIRDMASRCNDAVKQGNDPRIALRGDPAAMTVAEAWAHFVPESGWSERTIRENTYLWGRHIEPKLSARSLGSITSGDVAGLLARAAKKRTIRDGNKKREVGGDVASNRTRAALSALFSWAIERGLVDENPIAKTKPRNERPRDRVLRGDEVARLLAALDDSPEDFRDVVLLLLLTGCRSGEVLALRWREVSTGGSEPRLTIAATRAKARQTREVPLIPQAVEVLERRREKGEDDFVFPSESATGHLTRIKKSWEKMIKHSGIEHATPHDLRRSVAQACLDAGADFAVVSALLGHSHSSLGITGVYARPSLDRQRVALELGVTRLLGLSEEQIGEVMMFPGR